MTPLHIYRALTNTTPRMEISENVFVRHFNNVQREIYNLYGGKYTLTADTNDMFPDVKDIKTINDGSDLRDEYTGAVIDKIAFLHTGESLYNDGFNNKVSATYLNIWREMSRNKRVKPRHKSSCGR